MAAYLMQFERVATLAELPPDKWSVYLGSLLTGRSLKVYTSLRDNVAFDYEPLRYSLLRGFCKTPEAIRQEFRSLQVGSDETYVQYLAQLNRLLHLWLKSSGVDAQDPQSLTDFILVDQFLAAASPELRVFLRESGSDNIGEIATAADRWQMAHKSRKSQTNKSSKTASKTNTNRTQAGVCTC